MRFEVNDLLTIIGRQTVEIEGLKMEKAMLVSIRCPDRKAHMGEVKDEAEDQSGE